MMIRPPSHAERLQYIRMRHRGLSEEEASEPILQARERELRGPIDEVVRRVANMQFSAEEELESFRSRAEAINPHESEEEWLLEINQVIIPEAKKKQEDLKKELSFRQTACKREHAIKVSLRQDLLAYNKKLEDDKGKFSDFQETFDEIGKRVSTKFSEMKRK